MDSFTDRVKDIALSYTEIIHDTEDQSLETIENQSFSHTRREQPTSTASTSRSNNTRETVHDIFTDDVSEDETEMTTSHDIINENNFEIDRYKSVSMKK